MTEPDLLIEAGFSDARLAAEVQKLVRKYKEAGDAAQKAFGDASNKVTDQMAIRAHMRELDRLKSAYDPVYTATQKYEAAIKKLDRAFQIGAIGQSKYTEEVRRAQVELAKTAGVVGDGDLPRKAGLAGHEIQNLGFQVQDFAVQVAAGTDATRAFAQQFPQAASVFGPWGTAIGTVAAIAVPLGAALLSMRGGASDLKKQLDELAKSTDAMTAAAEAATTPIFVLQNRYGDLADEVARANSAMASLTALSARFNLQNTARSAGLRYGSMAPPEVPVGLAGDANRDRLWMIQRQQERLMENLRRQTGATADQADRLRMALYRMETSNSLEAVAKDAENLLSIISELALNEGADVQGLNSWAQQVQAILSAAQAQMEATRSESERLFNTYDKNTQDLAQLAEDRKAAEARLTAAVKSGNDEQVAAYGRVIAEIDRQIAKLRDLARESDEAFQKMAASFRDNLGDKLAAGFERVFGSSPAQFGKDASAAQKGIRELIKSRESGGNYNITLDNNAYTGGARDLVNMTINEVLEMQRQMLAHPANKKNSSAAGAYQIVRKTLQSLVDELGLTGSELYDEKMQDRLADQLIRRRRGQGIEGLRNEWEGLRGVNPVLIQEALGNQSIARDDPEAAAARKKALDDEVRARQRQTEVARQLGDQLAANLLTTQQTADLDARRAEGMRQIAEAGLSGEARSAAVAQLNSELERQETIWKLLADAKRRNVDVDGLVDASQQQVLAGLLGLQAGTITYRQAIEALGDAQAARVVTEQQVAAELERTAAREQFLAQTQDQLKNGILDAIVAGESFSDVLANLAQMLAKAALQAALFNEGPFASGGGGTGLLGSLISGIFGGFRAAGGPVDSGRAYVVGERGPEIIVPRSPGQVIPNHRISGSGTAVNINISLAGANGDEAVARIAQASVMQGLAQYDHSLPGRVQQIRRNPRMR